MKKIKYILSFIAILFIIFGSGISFIPKTKTYTFVETVSNDTLTILAGNAYEAISLLYLDLPKKANLKLLK